MHAILLVIMAHQEINNGFKDFYSYYYDKTLLNNFFHQRLVLWSYFSCAYLLIVNDSI